MDRNQREITEAEAVAEQRALAHKWADGIRRGVVPDDQTERNMIASILLKERDLLAVRKPPRGKINRWTTALAVEILRRMNPDRPMDRIYGEVANKLDEDLDPSTVRRAYEDHVEEVADFFPPVKAE